MENPSIEKVVLRTKNAAKYHNRILPVVAPFILDQYGIELVSIIHNKTQDGKGPADLYFDVVKRFVDRYIESLDLDVVTPMDLVNAINHGAGLKWTVAELFDIDMEHADMKWWRQGQRKDAKESKFSILGRCNIIEYQAGDREKDIFQSFFKGVQIQRPRMLAYHEVLISVEVWNNC